MILKSIFRAAPLRSASLPRDTVVADSTREAGSRRTRCYSRLRRSTRGLHESLPIGFTRQGLGVLWIKRGRL